MKLQEVAEAMKQKTFWIQKQLDRLKFEKDKLAKEYQERLVSDIEISTMIIIIFKFFNGFSGGRGSQAGTRQIL